MVPISAEVQVVGFCIKLHRLSVKTTKCAVCEQLECEEVPSYVEWHIDCNTEDTNMFIVELLQREVHRSAISASTIHKSQ